MTKSYAETFNEHLRICILRWLSDVPDYAANNSMLTDAVREFGLKASRDMVDAQIAWLAEQSYVSTERLTPTLSTVTLTRRGLDVATGVAVVPGVRRPDPKG